MKIGLDMHRISIYSYLYLFYLINIIWILIIIVPLWLDDVARVDGLNGVDFCLAGVVGLR